MKLMVRKAKPSFSQLGRRSKRKGKAFEKDVAEDIASWIDLPIEDVTRARSGKDECDIGLSTEARRRFPFYVEAKNQKSLAIPAWLAQLDAAVKKSKTPLTPLLVFKQHGDGRKLAVVDFDVFMQLVTMAYMKAEGDED